MSGQDIAAVFGGTGFLGRRIVDRLAATGWHVRAISRHRGDDSRNKVARVQADVRDVRSVREAVEGCRVAVNAVSLYVESGDATFEAIHVRAAADLAAAAKEKGVEKLIHISGVGSNPNSSSAYVAARGKGEEEVQKANDATVIVRPCVMFGEGDAFLRTFDGILRKSPFFPLFGNGDVRLQPVYVDDVAAAIARIAMAADRPSSTYELGGPETLTYREIVGKVAAAARQQPMLVPLPPVLWQLLATLSAPMKSPPITEGQVALLRQDNIAAGRHPGLQELGIAGTSVGAFLSNARA